MKIKKWMLAGLLAVGMNGAGKVLAGNLESAAAAWSIPYGREFWRQAQPASKTTEVKAEESAAALAESGVNIGDVMERVACSFRAGAEGEALAAEGRTYRAVYERNGVAFSPFLPARSNVAERISEEPSEARLEKRREARPDPATLPSPDPATAARFRTVRVTVGDTVLYDAADAPALAEESALGNTIQRLLNAEAGLVEHWQTRREGMEVAWVLQKPPAGGGPLVIEVEAVGLGLVGATANVAHYGNGGVGRVRISGATAVDAEGKRCELAMRIDGGRIAYELPATFLVSAAYPLAVDPIISAEFGMDNPLYVPAAGYQFLSKVAWGGTNFLVVWADDRSGSNYDIYGARVSSSGAVLDPAGIAICTAVGSQWSPSVSWNGSHFLVVWQDCRSVSSPDIYGARVSSDGAVLDPAGIAICTVGGDRRNLAVAGNGSLCLVVWDDYGGGLSDIYGARVNSAGVVLDSAGIAISTVVGNKGNPAVAWNGTSFLVVWDGSRNGFERVIYGARVSSSGAVLDPAGIVICTAAGSQWRPSVSWNGSLFLVVWEDYRNGLSDIYGARVNSAGAVLDSAGIPICTVADRQVDPSVVGNRSHFLVVWEDYRNGSSDIYGARVNSAGAVLDPAGIAISTAEGSQKYPSVTCDGSRFLVVWQDSRGGSSDIYGARVSSVGVVLDPVGAIISTESVNEQFDPSVAWNGTNFLVVWVDERNGSDSDIYGTRVSSAGVALDPAGIAICITSGYQFSPSVAWDGSHFLVVWQDDRNGLYSYDIYGARVSSSGAVLDPAGIAISTAAEDQHSPSVAWDGSHFLVVWYEYYFRRSSGDIYGARVSSSGAVLDPAGIAICTAEGWQWYPSVACNGSDFLVVWGDDRSGPNDDIYGARVSSAGAVLDPAGIAICTADGSQGYPSVTCDGSHFLVVWGDDRSGLSDDIYGARVSSAGAVLDPAGIAICAAADNQYCPSVSWNGSHFLVVWDDYRSGLSDDIYGARVSSAGAVLDPVGIAVDLNEGAQRYPAVAAGSNGKSLVVCEGWCGATRTVGVMIQDTESTVTVAASDPTAGEHGTSCGTGTFTFTRTVPLTAALKVNFTVGGTATRGGDYIAIGTTVVFAAGSATATKTVSVIDDRLVEGNETVGVTLANGTGYTVGSPSSATVTIKDDEALVRVSATDTLAGEPGTGTFTFTRTAPLNALTVNFKVSGTAAAGSDYRAIGTTVSFAAGSAMATKTVKVLNDHLVEGDETVRVTLTCGAGYNVGSPSAATVTIRDDDP